MLETFIQAKIKKWLKKHGWKVVKLRATDPPGLPDLIALRSPKQVMFIEVKQPGKKPTPLQQKNIELLRGMGFRVEVWDGIPAVWDGVPNEERDSTQ